MRDFSTSLGIRNNILRLFTPSVEKFVDLSLLFYWRRLCQGVVNLQVNDYHSFSLKKVSKSEKSQKTTAICDWTCIRAKVGIYILAVVEDEKNQNREEFRGENGGKGRKGIKVKKRGNILFLLPFPIVLNKQERISKNFTYEPWRAPYWNPV